MNLDYILVFKCLDEVEDELRKVGVARCSSLHDKTQISAVITLLFRTTSLFRSMLWLLDRGELDSYDVVRRAYFESWLLAFEFRLQASQNRSAQWHEGISGSWSADIRKLEEYARSEGIGVPAIGKGYGGLSEVAHPTKKAAWHSIRVATARHEECPDITGAKAKLERTDVPALHHGLVWILDERPGWIARGVDPRGLTNASTFARLYAKQME